MNEKKKMGRPTDNPRNKSLHLRLSEKELEAINKCSEKLNLPRTDVIVKAIELYLTTLK